MDFSSAPKTAVEKQAGKREFFLRLLIHRVYGLN